MIKQNLKKENDFMNIIDIAKEIEAKEKKTDAVSIVKTEWKPSECKEYTLPEFTISKSFAKDLKLSTCNSFIYIKFDGTLI